MNKLLIRCILAILVLAMPAVAGAQAPKPDEQKKQETLRPEVGTPLQAAQDLLKANKAAEALAKVQEADAVANKTPYESYLVERMRAASAAGAGDVPSTIKALEAVLATDRLTHEERMTMAQSLAGLYYKQKEYAKAASWTSTWLKEGGNDPKMRLLLAQSYYQAHDYANAAPALDALVEQERAQGKPPEDLLRLLANSYAQLNDAARYKATMETLATYYPKKDYWSDLVKRVPQPADRMALDMLRVRIVPSVIESAGDYVEMAQGELAQAYSAEAKKALDRGFADGILGTGPDAQKHQQLLATATKQLAEDRKALEGNAPESLAAAQNDGGYALVNLGFAYVTNAAQYERGIALMERGMKKGEGAVKNRKEQASRLRLAIAYVLAGQKDKALAAFAQVEGTPGETGTARLWTIYVKAQNP